MDHYRHLDPTAAGPMASYLGWGGVMSFAGPDGRRGPDWLACLRLFPDDPAFGRAFRVVRAPLPETGPELFIPVLEAVACRTWSRLAFRPLARRTLVTLAGLEHEGWALEPPCHGESQALGALIGFACREKAEAVADWLTSRPRVI